MTSLVPYQEQLLGRLDSDRTKTILVRAPVGAGLTEVLAHLAAKRTATGDLVIVITPHRLLVEQWADRLARIGCEVTLVRREADLTASTPAPGRARGHVVVATAALLHRPLARQYLASLQGFLLILDGIASMGGEATVEALKDLIAGAEQTIATSSVPLDPAWLSETKVVDWMPDPAILPRAGERKLTVRNYPVDDLEVSAYTRAVQLLGEAAGREIRPGSRPSLLASVLRAATRPNDSPLEELDFDADVVEAPRRVAEPRPGLEDDLWATADMLDSLATDGRLIELGALVRTAREARRPCLVSTETVEEARYVSEHLHGIGVQNAVITGVLPKRERDKAFTEWQSGAVLVATNALVDSLDHRTPDRTLIVWWSPPGTRAGLERRLSLVWGEGVEVAVLISRPRLPRDAFFLSEVLPWARSDWRGNLAVIDDTDH